ncbi:hypothetical protein RND81_09G250700 [Saponaria officinalis]|uniref:Uncharacterized protein n=1 Tax=Saponaria officinalis TaxID=3572 RepID=A0AAW1IS30_SAPOF
MPWSWPRKVEVLVAVVPSVDIEWTMADLSADAVARRWPSEENLREEIARLWGFRVWVSLYGGVIWGDGSVVAAGATTVVGAVVDILRGRKRGFCEEGKGIEGFRGNQL